MKSTIVLVVVALSLAQAVSLSSKTKAQSVVPADVVEERKGCSGSEFGCCPDGIAPAAGAHFYGCPETELSQTRVSENCANTAFGCCPDQVRAATGPAFGGCGGDGTIPSTPDKLGGYPDDISEEDASLDASVPDFWPADNIHEARQNNMRAAATGGLPYEDNRSFGKDLTHLDPKLYGGEEKEEEKDAPGADDAADENEDEDEEDENPEEPDQEEAEKEEGAAEESATEEGEKYDAANAESADAAADEDTSDAAEEEGADAAEGEATGDGAKEDTTPAEAEK